MNDFVHDVRKLKDGLLYVHKEHPPTKNYVAGHRWVKERREMGIAVLEVFGEKEAQLAIERDV